MAKKIELKPVGNFLTLVLCVLGIVLVVVVFEVKKPDMSNIPSENKLQNH